MLRSHLGTKAVFTKGELPAYQIEVEALQSVHSR